MNRGRGDVHTIVCSKALNTKILKHERLLTNDEIIDRFQEKVVLVITQMRAKSKLWIHSNL